MMLLIGLSVPAGAARRVAPEEFLISFWCGPPPAETTPERYREIAGAGFNAVLPPCGGPITPELNRRLLGLCAQNGLKAIVSDPRLEAAEAASADLRRRRWTRWWRTTGSRRRCWVTSWGMSRTRRSSRGWRRWIGACGRGTRSGCRSSTCSRTTPRRRSSATPTYQAYVRQYLETVRPKLLSFDHYALVGQGERPSYFENLEVIRREALRAEVPFASIVLATPHDPYRDPTEADLRWQVYTSLAYGARGILYFTYWTPQERHVELPQRHSGRAGAPDRALRAGPADQRRS